MEDLLEQLKEKLNILKDQIQESGPYNDLMEKYHTLPSNGQKAVNAGGILFVLFIVLSLPWSFYSTSQENIEEFDKNRLLIRDLFRASRHQSGGLAQGVSVQRAISNAQTTVTTLGLVPEQIGRIDPLPKQSFIGNFAKPPVLEEGFGVELKQLNVRQVVQAGYAMQNLGPGIKLVGLDMKANAEDDHYYDVLFKLMTFNLPPEPAENEGGSGGRGSKSRGDKNSRKGPPPPGPNKKKFRPGDN